MKRTIWFHACLLGMLGIFALATGPGCKKKGKDGSSSGDKAAKEEAPRPGEKSWEDLKAEVDKIFDNVNTGNAGDVDAAIAKLKKVIGGAHRVDGDKEHWYGKTSGGKCGEIWTLKGGGYGSSGSVADEHCK